MRSQHPELARPPKRCVLLCKGVGITWGPAACMLRGPSKQPISEPAGEFRLMVPVRKPAQLPWSPSIWFTPQFSEA